MKISKIQKKWIIGWSPILILFIVVMLWHFHMQTRLLDDLWWANYVRQWNQDGGVILVIRNILGRYFSWTSRLLPELTIAGLLMLPGKVWKICDVLLYTITAVMISKMFIEEEKRLWGNIFLVALMLMLPYTWVSNAGWVCTTVCYVWPFCFAMIAICPMLTFVNGRKPSKWMYIVSFLAGVGAAFSEQTTFVVFIVYMMGLFYQKKVGEKIGFAVAMSGVGLAGIISTLLCPGNAARELQEIDTWFPIAKNFSIIKKVEMGVSATAQTLIMADTLLFSIFLVQICFLVWSKNKTWRGLVCGGMPLIIYGSIHTSMQMEGNRFKDLITQLGFFNESNVGSVRQFGNVFICLCMFGFIVFDAVVIFGKTKECILFLSTFLIGLASKAVIGLSPTVWVSGTRTGWTLWLAIIICILILLKKWEYTNEKLVVASAVVMIYLGGVGAITNYYQIINVH